MTINGGLKIFLIIVGLLFGAFVALIAIRGFC